MAVRESSRDYANPARPLALRLYNALGRVGGPRRLDVDAMVARARKRSGLEEFEVPEFREPLEVLVDALEREARLTATGRFMTKAHAHTSLVVNLRARAWSKAEPAILDTKLARPIMVCGLARSGTTLLQRMLARLPGARALPSWEALEPIPEPSWTAPANPLDDARVGRARKAEGFLRWLSPDLFTVHPMDATAPEEDVMVLDQVFMSGVAESTYRVPSYASWLEQQDQRPAYRWLIRCLKQLQYQRPGDFWVLKSPHHLEWLDTVFELFPDITIVQTHRDPVVTLPSFCSLVAHGWGVMSDHVDPHEVGRHWTRKIERMLGRALATRDARDGEGFVDVHYADLTADPLKVMAELCERLALPFSDDTRRDLETWLGDNRQHKHGIHRYAAEDFNLSEGELCERFADYRSRFGFA